MQQFKELTSKYIQAMELIDARISFDSDTLWKYQHTCSMKYFHNHDDGKDYILVSRSEVWREYMSNAQSLYKGKISYRRLDRCVSDVICSLDEWPPTEEQIEIWTTTITEWADKTCSSQYRVLIPIYNLSMTDDVDQITLGKCVLYRGSENSSFAEKSLYDKWCKWRVEERIETREGHDHERREQDIRDRAASHAGCGNDTAGTGKSQEHQ